MFLHGPDKRLMHFALGLRRHDLQILAGLLPVTGHCTLNRHLAIMNTQDALPYYAQLVVKKKHHLLGNVVLLC